MIHCIGIKVRDLIIQDAPGIAVWLQNDICGDVKPTHQFVIYSLHPCCAGPGIVVGFPGLSWTAAHKQDRLNIGPEMSTLDDACNAAFARIVPQPKAAKSILNAMSCSAHR